MIDPFLLWLESTALSTWIRESTSVFAFPGILSAHAIGMGLAAGINGALALRVLGAAPQIPVNELRRFMPVMWFGFWLNAASGLALFIAYPTKAITNPIFAVKLSLIAGAMWVFVVLRRRLFSVASGGRLQPDVHALVRGVRLQPDLLAVISLLCWAGAIVAGRLLAYTYTRLMADW